MRYEHIMKSPCPDCKAALIKVVTFCCVSTADIICEACGYRGTISIAEYNKMLHSSFHASNMGGIRWFKYRTKTPEELAKTEAAHAISRLKHANAPFPMELDCYDKIPEETIAELNALLVEYKYVVVGPQIGFVGKDQKFDPPWQL